MLNDLISNNLYGIANTIFITFLVLVGGRINKQFYQSTRKTNIVTRIALFLAFSVLGYALVTKYGTLLTHKIITMNGGEYSTLIAISLIILIGIIAEKLKYGK
jgi:hypothetical protein